MGEHVAVAWKALGSTVLIPVLANANRTQMAPLKSIHLMLAIPATGLPKSMRLDSEKEVEPN